MSNGTFILDPEQVATNRQTPDRQVVVSLGAAPDFVPGRRSWVRYRELGLTEASAGAVRAQVIHAGNSNEPTGWHLHRCDMQFLYVVDGAITIVFSPERIIRMTAGDSIMIPGGTIHMEVGAPEGVEVIELSLPAEMGTENVASPWGDVDIDLSRAMTIERPVAEMVGA